MRRFLVAALLLSAGTVLPAQNTEPPPQQPSVQLPPALDRVLRDYETRFRIGGDTLAALFSEDGFVLPSGQPPVRGRSAIARYYGRAGGPLALRAIAYATSGDVGYIIGGYRFAEDTTDTGKYTLTLRRAPGGRWLIYSDMDNPNTRPRRP